MKLKSIILLAVLAVTVGCAGIGSSILKMRPDYSKVPDAELRAAADAIENAAVQGERDPQLGTFTGVNLDTPAIKQAIRTRAVRAKLVSDLLASGHAHEQQSGTLKIMNSREYKRSTTSRERDQNALLVMNENENRWTLYEGIRKASNWPAGALGAVQHTFYEARVALMASGHKYENAQGNIVVK